MRLRPDPTFYPSPRMAMAGEKEKLAYVAAFDAGAALGRPGPHLPDALATGLASTSAKTSLAGRPYASLT